MKPSNLCFVCPNDIFHSFLKFNLLWYLKLKVSKWELTLFKIPIKIVIFFNRPNWLSLSTTFFNKAACHKVPIPLYDILSIDEKKLTVTVEPMVSVGDITRYNRFSKLSNDWWFSGYVCLAVLSGFFKNKLLYEIFQRMYFKI